MLFHSSTHYHSLSAMMFTTTATSFRPLYNGMSPIFYDLSLFPQAMLLVPHVSPLLYAKVTSPSIHVANLHDLSSHLRDLSPLPHAMTPPSLTPCRHLNTSRR
jgi:hypothetical protein